MKAFAASLLLLATAWTAPAYAACPERVVTSGGDASLSALARACGVNVEALKSINPGMTGSMVRQGTVVRIPQQPIVAPQFEFARPQARTPSLEVPLAPGPSTSTVILPPPPVPVPQQHILRGFGDQPGQLPLPEGHAPPTFAPRPLFPQFN